MEPSDKTVKPTMPASGEAVLSAADTTQVFPTGWNERIEAMIASDLPLELQPSAHGLLRAITGKAAVAEHFDAFCGHAFSKPEWAAAASPLIAELFEHDEDQLAELARIPDLVIEMGSGQVTVTCMVASRWAARGETYRLSRLAESIVASHVSKNACAVEVMLALSATLAVTRFSKAEQLYNAALPLVGDEHQEALVDARRWLAVGRIICSTSQEERDFWDLRLRKPKTAWTWHNKDERGALESLSECLSRNAEGSDFFQALVPPCWWDMAMKCVQQKEKLSAKMGDSSSMKPEPEVQARANIDFPTLEKPRSQAEIPLHPQPSLQARFVLGWVCGAMAMVITVLLLPTEVITRVLSTFRTTESASPHVNASKMASFVAGAVLQKTPAQKQAWRKQNLEKISAEMERYSSIYDAVKTGRWNDHETVLFGQAEELPQDSPQFMKMLIWLHLDPPQDEETRVDVAKLLLGKIKSDAIPLWEELTYPGSANADALRQVAAEALLDASFSWNEEEKRRLRLLADGVSGAGSVSAAVTKP